MSLLKAVVVLNGAADVKEVVQFTQEGDGPTTVTGKISGLSPGLHGFHVHALGDTTVSKGFTDLACTELKGFPGITSFIDKV